LLVFISASIYKQLFLTQELKNNFQMNILILGAGGREHAFAYKIAESKNCDQLFVAPGNAGTSQIAKNVNLKVTNFAQIKDFVLKENIEMVVVGPEDPLVEGIYDFFMDDV